MRIMRENNKKILQFVEFWCKIKLRYCKKKLCQSRELLNLEEIGDSFAKNSGVYTERKANKLMCKAAEVGKIVVNKCLDRNLSINAQKLQKLLVLMQVECIRRSQKPLFREDIRIWNCGVAIKEVDDEFNCYGEEYNGEKMEEFITLLDAEEESVEYVLCQYGAMDVFDLNSLPDIQKVELLGVKTEDLTVPHISYQILMGAFFE